MDSIHIAKLRREQEELQNRPLKAVDSIAVTKARREQAQISSDLQGCREGFVDCKGAM